VAKPHNDYSERSTIAFDPVESGLVASMNRPGGNVTGISLFSTALVAKRIELLRDLAPNASIVGFPGQSGRPSAKTDEQTAEAAAGIGPKASLS